MVTNATKVSTAFTVRIFPLSPRRLEVLWADCPIVGRHVHGIGERPEDPLRGAKAEERGKRQKKGRALRPNHQSVH